MKVLFALLGMMLIFNTEAAESIDIYSDNAEPTVVFGEAENANGTFNQMMVEQGDGVNNPFGNPVVDEMPEAPQSLMQKTLPLTAKPKKMPANIVSEVSTQNPQIGTRYSPEKMQNEIQNTLYESNNRIYDLQSYPDSDINQIENQGNAVTNYPEY